MKTAKSLIIFLFTLGVFFACEPQDSNVSPSFGDDALIAAIQAADNKVAVSQSELPTGTDDELTNEYSKCYVDKANFAPELGYEVTARRQQGSQVGESVKAYFDLNGRMLREGRKGKRPRGGCKDCFTFVFPVSFTMPDGSSITATDPQNLGETVKAWYEANPDVEGRPEPVFPITIMFGDVEQEVASAEDLRAIVETCQGDKEPRQRCFELVFPVTVTMSDGTAITGSSPQELREQMKAWVDANPDLDRKPSLNFPVDVVYPDGTTATANSEEDMKALKESCED